MKIEYGEHIGLIGSTGGGKTNYYRAIIEPSYPRQLIVDTEERQFDDIKEIRRHDGISLAKAIPRKVSTPFKWRWVPPATHEIEQMEKLCEGLIRYAPPDTMVYIDEASDFMDAHKVGDWLKIFFRKARKRKITIAWGTQRPSGANHWAIDNTPHVYMFFIKPGRDREVMHDYYRQADEDIEWIEFKSFKSLYIGPDGNTVRQLPCPKVIA
jgi:hypothetical protein